MDFRIRVGGGVKLTRREWKRIQPLKELDIQVCNFCQQTNILNLGWKPFGKFYCRLHEAEHLVCPELCYKVCLRIWGCQLYKKVKESQRKLVVINHKYNRASCYLCGKWLRGAGKHGIVKNRNNPSFWGIATEFKILCLGCLKKKFYLKLGKEKRKMLNKYVKRGYE